MRTRMLPAMSVILLGLAACAGTGEKDYDRHRMSAIGVSAADPGVYVFEAKISPKFPADSAAAEQVRLDWLADWMTRRDFCSGGYEVLERRPFAPDEPNPYRSDLRYTVKCAEPD